MHPPLEISAIQPPSTVPYIFPGVSAGQKLCSSLPSQAAANNLPTQEVKVLSADPFLFPPVGDSKMCFCLRAPSKHYTPLRRTLRFIQRTHNSAKHTACFVIER